MLAGVLNVGGGEILLILVIALLVLGPDRLPTAGRQIGKALAEFRRVTSGVQEDLREAMDVEGFRETVESLRDGLDIRKTIAAELTGVGDSLQTNFSTKAPAKSAALGSSSATTGADLADGSSNPTGSDGSDDSDDEFPSGDSLQIAGAFSPELAVDSKPPLVDPFAGKRSTTTLDRGGRRHLDLVSHAGASAVPPPDGVFPDDVPDGPIGAVNVPEPMGATIADVLAV